MTKYFWYLQSIFSTLTLIFFLLIAYSFLHVFYAEGDRLYALKIILMPDIPGYLILIMIATGSLFQWKLAIFLSLIYAYITINNILHYFAYHHDHFIYGNTNIYSILAMSAALIMSLLGLMLFIQLIKIRYKYEN